MDIENTIRICVEGGVVQDVLGLPEGWSYTIYDVDDAEHECDNCQLRLAESQLVLPIPDLLERVEPGGVMPSGVCPECRALAYPLS